TMRTFSEEKKSGTIELLLTYPVRDIEAVLGKFAGCLGIFAIMISFSLPCLLLVAFFGDPELGVIITGYVGLLFMGGAFISLGIFMSTLTENQVIAAVLSFAALLLLYMVGYSAGFVGEGTGTALEYISILSHLDSFAKGVLDTSDIIYYVLFAVFFLFLSMRTLESKRWRA
ncbi:MAG: ABC transporter permease subunit, partial [Nitrospinae bacterium]|nr:ABC transporter permease subunit [Nitrospinota bacterium]